MLASFAPALAGGMLIGLAAALLWVGLGRIAGISGIIGGLASPLPGEVGWRGAFVAGLLCGGVALGWGYPAAFAGSGVGTPLAVGVSGLLVGFGTRLGNGCTSGHGVCGLGRGSLRSLVATACFMAFGFLTVAVVNHVAGRPG